MGKNRIFGRSKKQSKSHVNQTIFKKRKIILYAEHGA